MSGYLVSAQRDHYVDGDPGDSLVLPATNRCPPCGLQFGIRVAVPFTIALDLLRPIPAVGLTFAAAVIRAAVPEAAVNKDCNPGLREDDVGLSAQIV